MLRSPRRPPLRARCHSACSSGVSPEPRDPTLETVEAASRARKVVGRCTSTVPHLPLALQPQRHVRSRARRGSEAELVFIARIHERDSARARARGVSPPPPWHARCPCPEDAPVAIGDWRHVRQRHPPRVTAAGRARAGPVRPSTRVPEGAERGARLRLICTPSH